MLTITKKILIFPSVFPRMIIFLSYIRVKRWKYSYQISFPPFHSEVIRKLITCQNKHVRLEMIALKIIYISFSGLNNFKGILKFLSIIQFTLVLTYSHIEGPAWQLHNLLALKLLLLLLADIWKCSLCQACVLSKVSMSRHSYYS